MVNDDLIAKYLAGEADPDEAMALEDWIQLVDNRQHFENLRETWHKTSGKKIRAVDSRRAWESLEQAMDVPLATEQNVRTIPFRPYSKIAASLLILIVAGVVVYFLIRNYNFSQPVTIYTANELREAALPDSSHIVLSRNSMITYNKNFNDRLRESHFSGEGFFDVTHNPRKPFVIHTELADIKVLGTTFNVAESGDKLEVSVAEGKVMVATNTDTVYVEGGHSAAVHRGSTAITTGGFNDENTWAYATRKFNFRNTRLNEVFRCIEKSFPYAIKVNNKAIENCRLTANFNNTSADYMVTLIAETLDLSVTKTDHEFILEGNGCK